MKPERADPHHNNKKGDRMKLIIPRYASSMRTIGFPIYIINENGEILETFYTYKRQQIVDIEGNAKFAIRLYWSNSGRVTIFVYSIKKINDGMYKIDDKPILVKEEPPIEILLKELSKLGLKDDTINTIIQEAFGDC